MKTIFTSIILVVLLFFFDAKDKHPAKEKVIHVSSIDTLGFNSKVLPILRKNCSPCHFEGGKMYARMPFDQPSTLTGHETVALRRFKDPNELAILKKFLQVDKVK
jgi:hypothetical protein